MAGISVALKRLGLMGLCLLLCLHGLTAAVSARDGDVVMDLAGLLSYEEWEGLETDARALAAELGVDFVIYTDTELPDPVEDVLYDGSPLLYLAVDGMYLYSVMGGIEVPDGFPLELMEEIVAQVDGQLAAGQVEDGLRHFLTASADFLRDRDSYFNPGQSAESTAESAAEDTAESATDTADDSLVRVFDYNNLLSGAEEEALSQRAAALSQELGMQFVLITREENSGAVENIDYADSFYMEHFHGAGMVDGISMCLDTSNRIYSINTFGRARELISDWETGNINDSVRELMREDRFRDVFDQFLDQSSDLLRERLAAEWAEQERQAEIQERIANLEVPVPDPDAKIYDYAGILDEQTAATHVQQAREYKERLGVDFLFVTTTGQIAETLSPYLERFYQNYRDAGGDEACVLLVVDTELDAAACATFGELASAFDSQEWLASAVEDLLQSEDDPAQLLGFFYENTTEPINMARMLREMVVPQAEEGGHVYDFGDLLGPEEEAAIREQIASYDGRGSLMVVIADLESPELLGDFAQEFTDQNGFGDDSTALFLCAATGEATITGGSESLRFRYREQEEVAEEVASLAREGDAAAGIQVYLDRMPRYMNRLLPDIDMVDLAGSLLAASALFGLVVALVAVGIMALFQLTLKGKPPKRFTYTAGGLELHYKKDTLVSSVVTQAARPKESSSSSSSGTSYGGGSNSGGSSSRY